MTIESVKKPPNEIESQYGPKSDIWLVFYVEHYHDRSVEDFNEVLKIFRKYENAYDFVEKMPKSIRDRFYIEKWTTED